jgi:hypothetical protein
MASDQAQTPAPSDPPPRIFYSIAAAEDAYRQEQERNDALGAKIDDLGRTLGGKLDKLTDKLTSLMEQFLARMPSASPPASAPIPSVTPAFKYESTPPPFPGPPLAPPKFESTPFDVDLSPQTTTDPLARLRTLNLLRSRSDPEIETRRQFMQRDRSVPPPRTQSPSTRIPVQPFGHGRRSPSPRREGSSKPLVGVKLPVFRGKYTDNVHAWLTVIRDRFHLHKTPDDEKIPNISALFEDDALVWYLDLRRKYPRPPTWEEFELELEIKFAQNPVRISWLRRLLKSLKYDGPQDMEKYVSEFRSIEIQISNQDMAFGDRLNYFLETFNILDPTLKLQIQDLHPRQMEIAYDAALNFAWSRIEKQEREKGGPETIKRSLIRDPVVRFTDATKSSSKKRSGETDSDSDDLNMMNGDLRVCFRCQKPGHFAEKCLAPHPVPRSNLKQPTGNTDKRVHDKHARFSRVVKYQPNEKGEIEEKVCYMRMDHPPSGYDSDSDSDDRYLYLHGLNPRGTIYDPDYNSEYDGSENSDSEPPAGVYTIPGGGFMDRLYSLQ